MCVCVCLFFIGVRYNAISVEKNFSFDRDCILRMRACICVFACVLFVNSNSLQCYSVAIAEITSVLYQVRYSNLQNMSTSFNIIVLIIIVINN